MKWYNFTIVIATIVLLPDIAFAQKVRFGFLAGPNLTFALYDDVFPGPDTVDDVDPGSFVTTRSMKPGFSFFGGVIIDYDITDDLYLTGSVNLLGTRHNTTLTQVHFDTTEEQKDYHVFAFQMPVTLNYRLGKFTVGAGLYGAWAFTGRLKFQAGDRNLDFGRIETDTFGIVVQNAADFQPIIAGLRTELGYGLKRWRITVHYDLGLVGIAHKIEFTDGETVEKFTMKKHTLGLSFIYQPWPR